MPDISFDDFKKLDLRVGKITKAKPVEGATKLLLLEVDIGREKRNLVAGIAEQYSQKELVGKNVVVVVNLAPKKIRGVESEGMLLAAEAEGGPVLLTPDKDVAAGTKVR